MTSRERRKAARAQLQAQLPPEPKPKPRRIPRDQEDEFRDKGAVCRRCFQPMHELEPFGTLEFYHRAYSDKPCRNDGRTFTGRTSDILRELEPFRRKRERRAGRR